MLHCTLHDKSASYIIPSIRRASTLIVKMKGKKNGTPNAGCSLINNFFYVYAPSRQELQNIACGVPCSRENHNPAVCFILLFCYNVSRLQPHHLAYVYAHDKRYHKRDN